MFQLSEAEKAAVVANCDHLRKLKFSKSLPYAFTEHGAIQAANVLASAQAIEMGIYMVRAFVHLREMAVAHTELSRRVDELEHKAEAPLGCLHPCSQPCKVRTETPSRVANCDWDNPVRSRASMAGEATTWVLPAFIWGTDSSKSAAKSRLASYARSCDTVSGLTFEACRISLRFARTCRTPGELADPARFGHYISSVGLFRDVVRERITLFFG